MSMPAPPPSTSPPESHSDWHPDVILHNTTAYILDRPGHKAQAIAIKDGRVLDQGDTDRILHLAGPQTALQDVGGGVILPGLTDAHIHLRKYAQSMAQVDCGTDTPEETLQRLSARARATAPGGWITGHGWDQNLWGRFGTLSELDAATGDHPTYLTAKSLHAAWANSAALRIADIDSATDDPPGGSLSRDQHNRPTGILFEAAMALVSSRIQDLSPSSLADDLAAAQEDLWRMGLTGVHDFDGVGCFVALQQLREEDRLGLRVVKNILADDLEYALGIGLRTGFGDPWIRVGNVKLFADGALGPHTAAMLSPYETEPDNVGVLMLDEEDIMATATLAVDAGLAMTIHAIGDLANHTVLNALESLRGYESAHGLSHHRHRIEHLQLLHPDDRDRPQALDVIASMQPIHALSDRAMADAYWGDRVEHAYAWRSQLERGTQLAFGSDAPVDSPNPFLGLYAATTRAPLPGQESQGAWHPEECIPLWDALQAYTYGPAYASRQEHLAGSLLPGRLADLVVLDQDIFHNPPEALLETQVMGTMVGGRWRHRGF
jgi:predicted amidohydrolase YtcJ